MKLAISSAKDAHFVPGRRQFFQYRDLGVTETTGGKMRAQVTSAKSAMDRETGCHYHRCEMQFVYILRGWVALDSRVERFYSIAFFRTVSSISLPSASSIHAL
jgi:hypothetical protein